MKKTDILFGVFIGFLATFIGTFLFFFCYTDYSFLKGVKGMRSQGYLGKVITLGAILNLVAFFVLLKINKELMARGVVLATLILALITMFV